MKPKSKDQIEAEYADLLEGDRGDTWRLIHHLEAHYKPGDPLTRLPGPPAVTRASSRHGIHRRWPQWLPLPRTVARFHPSLAVGGTALVALLVSISVVLAASGILNLGKPTNAVSPNPYFPLSGFKRDTKLPTIAKVGGKAQVWFIGTLVAVRDSWSAIERWPMVKALDQFGRLSGVRLVDHVCTPNAQAGRDLCDYPSFDWSKASYRSAYVAFDHKDLLKPPARPTPDVIYQPYQRMSKSELKLYNRLVHTPSLARDRFDPYGASYAVGEQRLPIIAIGDYLAFRSQILQGADFDEQLPSEGPTPVPVSGYPVGPLTYPSGLSFQQVQRALQTQTDPKGTTVVEDVNAEANVITALICHADGNEPGGVCGRPIISSLTRRLK